MSDINKVIVECSVSESAPLIGVSHHFSLGHFALLLNVHYKTEHLLNSTTSIDGCLTCICMCLSSINMFGCYHK